MLAAELVRRFILGEMAPSSEEFLSLARSLTRQLAPDELRSVGMSRFARYASLARQGIKPGKVSLDCSLDGIFIAIRYDAGGDLSDPEATVKFHASWRPLAKCIFEAALQSIDPFTQSFLEDRLEFVKEREYLRHDQEVFRLDVLRGEQWLIQMPGAPSDS